jgi:hypothetical protein
MITFPAVAPVWEFAHSRTYALLLRRPALAGREVGLARDIAAWAAAAGFARVVLLAGADARTRSDEQLSGCVRVHVRGTRIHLGWDGFGSNLFEN